MKIWLLLLLRAVIMFFMTLALIRFMERSHPFKQSTATSFELVNFMVIAVVAALTSLAVINNMALGLLVLGVWILLPLGLERLALKNPWLDNLMHGNSPILVRRGKILTDNLWRARLSSEELLRELRAKNRIKLNDVEFATLEHDGRIRVYPKAGYQPLPLSEPEFRKIFPAEPQTVILSGSVLEEPLSEMGLTRDWLSTELQKAGVAVTDVSLAQADAAGDFYLDLFDAAADLPQPKVREMVYAALLNIRADFMTFALEMKDPAAKALYAGHAAALKTILGRLKPYLLH